MYPYIKRFFDLLFGVAVLLVISPFLMVIIIALAFTGEREIFYLQQRVGYKSRHFNIVKFATMLKNSPNMGTGDITVRNDPRVTPVGRFLRITKLNELPQLFNIISGDMSFVGPRPLVQKGFDDYPEDIRHKIYDHKPGLTGLGSVIFRDEELLMTNCEGNPREYYSKVIQPHKAKIELYYQQHAGFITDLKILFLTAWIVVSPKSRLVEKMFPGVEKLSV